MTAPRLDVQAGARPSPAQARADLPQRLLNLMRRLRAQRDSSALEFMLVNETHGLAPYQVACLWLSSQGLRLQSGVSTIDANAPFAQWIGALGEKLSPAKAPFVVQAEHLDAEDLSRWANALPAHAVWMPLQSHDARWGGRKGGLLLCRTEPWLNTELQALADWCDAWTHAADRLALEQGRNARAADRWRNWVEHLPSRHDLGEAAADVARGARFVARRLRRRLAPGLWRRSLKRWGANLAPSVRSAHRWRPGGASVFALSLLVASFPVRLSVLAPGALVPLDPVQVRVPIDGVIESFAVAPNEAVRQGQLLFQLERTTLANRLQQAEQAAGLATTEYRQGTLQSLADARSRTALASQQGRIYERQVEVDHLRSQLEKTRILAPRDGVALLDDPAEWVGRPVSTGEKVMLVAWPERVEVEVWLPVADAIALAPGAEVTLFLNTSPLSPLKAQLRYLSHEALARPDGTPAFRLRATLAQGSAGRAGLRGTARVSGDTTPLLYWVLRKPLAALRQWTGL